MTLQAIATLDPATSTNVGITLSNSDTAMALGGEITNAGCQTTIGNIIGSTPARYFRFYTEVTISAAPQNATWGLVQAGTDLAGFDEGGISDGVDGMLQYQMSGDIVKGVASASVTVATADSWSGGGVAQGAFDISNGLAWFRTGTGHWNGDASADPASGVGGIPIPLTGRVYLFGGLQTAFTGGQVLQFNFGQSPFAQTVPSGFELGWGSPTVLIGVLTWDGKRVAI